MSLDELTAFDAEATEIQQLIDRTSEETQKRIDWTRVWSKKYPVLATYPDTVDIAPYASALQTLLTRLKRDYRYSSVDACLVLKDILAHVWKDST